MSCRALNGEVVLTNGPRLDLDEHWRVEHCYPVAIVGWLVMVLRRHARALHELTDDEAASLGRWLPRLVRAMHHATGSEVEYVMQFAEGDGFQHVHFHLVARTSDWNPVWRGPHVWGAFGTAHPVDPLQVSALINAVGAELDVEAAFVGH
jgi:diadenosine tetraphosphate (Ap4A) HIT family hydrolase